MPSYFTRTRPRRKAVRWKASAATARVLGLSPICRPMYAAWSVPTIAVLSGIALVRLS